MPDIVDTTPTQQAPAAAPSQPQSPSVTPSSGASAAGAVGQPAAPAGVPPTGQSYKDQLTAAVNAQPTGQPAGQTNMLGQPTDGAAAQTAQPQASWEQVLAANPHLAPQFNALMQYAYAAQQQAYQAQRQPATPAAAPTGPEVNAFGIPKFDKSLTKYITTGPNGELQVSPYAPPGTLHAYEQWQEKRREAFENLLENPEKALGEIVGKMLDSRAPQIADSRIQNVQTQSYVKNYTDQNTWLWQMDAKGQPVVDWRGQRQLSDAGRYFEQVVRQLDAAGVRDVQMQVRLAEQQVAGALALSRQNAAQTAQQQSDQGKQNLLNSAGAFNVSPPTPQGNAAQPTTFVPNQPTGNLGAAFKNALEQGFAAHGLNGSLV